jgi:L-fuconate dehydratase
VIKDAAYMPPKMAGFSIEMKAQSRKDYLFKA